MSQDSEAFVSLLFLALAVLACCSLCVCLCRGCGLCFFGPEASSSTAVSVVQIGAIPAPGQKFVYFDPKSGQEMFAV